MSISSQKDLFILIKPAMDVSVRINKYYGYNDIKINEIWSYLVSTKWSNATNLSLSDIVNDIITFNYGIVLRKKVNNE